MISPIAKKEIETRSRRASFPAVISVVAIALFSVSLIGSLSVLNFMNELHEAHYGLMLRVYMAAAAAEYISMLLIAVLLAAPSIAGERETGTLDILLTTKLSPAHIVAEKFLSSFLVLLVFMVSGFPALIVPLMYGGVNVLDAVRLLLSFVPGVFMVLSAGMFISSLCSGITRSIGITYAFLILFSAGFILIPILTAALTGTRNTVFASILIFDPLTPLFVMLYGQLGLHEAFLGITEAIGAASKVPDPESILTASLIAETLTGIVLILLAARHIAPSKKL